MKKYKLIKKYPGSPELGETRTGSEENCRCYPTEKCMENNPEFWEEVVENHSVFHIGRSLTENHPGGKAPYYIYQDKESYCKENNIKYFYCKKDCEKWANEQVIKKDYEILTYKNFITGAVNFIGQRFLSNEGYREFTERDLNVVNEPTGRAVYFINSVKRLSDGEVFTVGDIINTKVDNKYKQEIIEINLGINGNFYKDRLTFKTKRGFVIINIAVKSKQPLFTTEDGADIYEGDTYYAYQESKEIYSTGKNSHVDKIQKVKISNFPNAISDLHKGIATVNLKEPTVKRFSTKEAAEEYILMNKPKYSLNDILASLPNRKCKKYNIIKHMIENLKKK